MGGPLTEKERNLWAALEAARGADSLLDFIPEASRARGDLEVMMRPEHLSPLADVFVRALTQPVFACVSVPPQHGKTETLLHGIAWWLWLRPQDPIIYTSYSGTFAKEKSRRVRDFATNMGLSIRQDAKSATEWMLTQGGGLRAKGRGGTITGHGARLLIVDDPFSNREEAESPVIRQGVHEWFTSTVMSRRQPKGSVIIVHTRWHDDDLIGRLTQSAEFPWEHINLPAFDESRKASGGDGSLWPQVRNAEFLQVQRRISGEYDWSSLYQGEPRPRGGRMFNDPGLYAHSFVAEPGKKWRIVIGVDPALTEKTSADYSVAVVLAVCGTPGSIDFQADILDVYRAQIEAPKLLAKLLNMSARWNAPLAIESVGGFRMVPQMLRQMDKNARIYEVTPLGDKFTRALPVAAAWNDGRVRVPAQGAVWLRDFMSEVQKFTGVKDRHDDCVDALAHAFNSLVATKPNTSYGVQRAPAEFS